jgi:Tol biopolymer transport system component
MRASLVLMAIVVLLRWACASAAIPNLRVIDLGEPAPDDLKNGWVVVSPDGLHVAYWAPGGGVRSEGMFAGLGHDPVRLMIDGRPSAPYQVIFKPAFSAVGGSVAFFASREKQFLLVVNAQEHDDDVSAVKGEPVFSPDGSRVAYYGVVSNGNPDEKKSEKKFIVCDGRKGKTYDAIGPLIFSADGRRLAYSAQDDDGRWRVVCDDAEGKPYEGIGKGSLAFSADGKHVAYSAKLGQNKWALVMDGKESPAAHFIGAPQFAPQGDLLGFSLFRDEDHGAFIVNGKRQGEVYDQIDDAIFSRDGRHFAFTARRDRRWHVVRDATEGAAYFDARDPVISGDGAHLAYVAQKAENDPHKLVVLDDLEQQPFDDASELCLSDTGGRAAYHARRGDRHFVVVAGGAVVGAGAQRGKEFDEIRHGAISPDGNHVAYWARDGTHWLLVVDETTDDSLDGPLAGATLAFTAPGDLVGLALQGRSIVRLTAKFSRVRM